MTFPCQLYFEEFFQINNYKSNSLCWIFVIFYESIFAFFIVFHAFNVTLIFLLIIFQNLLKFTECLQKEKSFIIILGIKIIAILNVLKEIAG